MNKEDIREFLKPLIKECIKEVIVDEGLLEGFIKDSVFEPGVLSGLIQEVAQGLGHQSVPRAPIQSDVQLKSDPYQLHQAKEELKSEFNFIQKQRIALQEEAIRTLEEKKKKLENSLGAGFEGIFENLDPISQPGNPSSNETSSSPLSAYASGDPGVDITGLMALAGGNWKNMI
jgi:hypothetical protein